MEEKIEKIEGLIKSIKKLPPNTRLFLTTYDSFILIEKGLTKRTWFKEEFGDIKKLKFERGEILDQFSKIEFIINEVIKLGLGMSHPIEHSLREDIVDSLDLFLKIRILNL